MPTTKPEHVAWFTFARHVDAWSELDEHDRHALQLAAECGAEAFGASVPPEPAAGWRSAAHSRDGKAYPCREQTTGAHRAWVWQATR